MITFEVIEEKQKIADYENHWREIFDAGKHQISTSLEWTGALLNTSLLRGDEFLLMVFRDSDKILGIVPLVLRRGKNYGLSVMHIFPIAELFNTHSDLLLANLDQELIRAFIEALFSLSHRWDVFRMRRFPEPFLLLEEMECHLEKTSIKYEIKREPPSFFISLGDSYDNYMKERSHNFRRDIKKKTKRMSELGSIEFIDHNNFNDLSDLYNEMLSIERKSWKYEHKTSIASTEKQTLFFKSLCECAYDNGWLRLSFLCLNQEPIAYNFGLVKDTKYYYLKTSYDEKYKDISPSSILRAKLVEELVANGIKEIDFTAEPYEWQRQWTDKFRWHKSLVIYNNTVKAKLYCIANHIRNKRKASTEDEIQFRNGRQ